MTGSQPRSLATAIVVGMACSAAAAAPQRDGWLSVKDFGASGSKFETTASATADSKEIVVKEVGDFQVGQGVTVSRCNIQIVSPLLRGPESPYSTKPLENALEIRGYDGSTSSWLVFLLEVDAAEPLSFRWSDIQACTEITIRNFRMIGHTGIAESAGAFRMAHGRASFWACALKPCNAIGMTTTERTLIENVHASRMGSECFYASGTARQSTGEAKQYQKSLTYLRCSVTDCAANAFNNNDMGENTSVLHCRIQDAGPGGWHAAEMPARFFRFIGNYVRNAGPVTVGDMSHRTDDLHHLGCGQSIVADNVFEGIGKCGGVRVNFGSSQVVIANNLFINYNGPAITASSETERRCFPSHTVTIKGNLIDLTSIGDKPAKRTGITVSTSNTIVADNQVYVRGPCDPLVTGIAVAEPALNVTVHDNLIRDCRQGLVTRRVQSSIKEVIDPTTFLETRLPLEWKDSHLYRGWNLAWLTGSRPNALSVIEAFDPVTFRFTLRAPHEMKPGDSFCVFPSGPANWNFHDNTITGCTSPVVLDSYGSETSLLKGNLITRGAATGVKAAVEVGGQFKLIGNHVSGFDQPGSAALSLASDPLARVARSVYRNNIFERCAAVVRKDQAAFWDAAKPEGNVFVECGESKDPNPAASP